MKRNFDPDILARIDADMSMNLQNNKHKEAMDNFEIIKNAEMEQNRRDVTEIAGVTKQLYDEFITVGFTEQQAWELITIHFNNATRKTSF